MNPKYHIHPEYTATLQQKTIVNMCSALRVKYIPQSNNVYFDASISIFGLKEQPNFNPLFEFILVLLKQIQNMVQLFSHDYFTPIFTEHAFFNNNL